MQPPKTTSALYLGALGVVYGDIGTSPLYALKSCFVIGGLSVTAVNVLGLLSLFFWTLFLVITLKYVNLVLRVDNQGEGGILALSSLVGRLKHFKKSRWPVLLGLLGAALFFGDGVITPAISVLGALEGIELVAPQLTSHIPLLAIGVLTLLFIIQKKGSGHIGLYFGPVMVVWFTTLAVLGAVAIFTTPTVLAALNPYYAYAFFIENTTVAMWTLGGVFLVVTGGEALYADLGHFGKTAIMRAWTFFVFPCLVINYFGQGALLLNDAAAITNPFYLLAPASLLYPLLILSTCATIIASQAVISGVFSLAWQAIMLNHLPRMKVLHTSYRQIGQVYVPIISHILYVLTITAVWHFEQAANLATAYGVSIAGVMLITTILIYLWARYEWHWSSVKLMMVFLPLVSLDIVFVLTNWIKFFEGAWFTLLITLGTLYIIWVWHRGTRALNAQRTILENNLPTYINEYEHHYSEKIPGTAIFMTRNPNQVPSSLLVQLKHNKLLHAKVLFVSVVVSPKPHVAKKNSFSLAAINNHTFVLTARFGFKQVPNLNKIIKWAYKEGVLQPNEDISIYLSHGVAVASPHPILKGFGEWLYIFLSKNALAAYEFYKIPHQAVIELGVRYKI